MFERLSPTRIRAIREGLSIAGVICLAYFWSRGWPNPGIDSFASWNVDASAPYDFNGDPYQFGAFRYSPAAAQAFQLLNWLPWEAFFWTWLGILFGAVLYIGRWWGVALLIFPPLVYSLWTGNIDVLLAAAIVAGFRWPGAWAIVLLTKVTPGIGLLWFALRGEWRSFATALGTTFIVVGVSFALAPGLWFDWPRELLSIQQNDATQPLPLPLRIAGAALLVVWGARTDRRWTVIVAAFIAIPQVSLRAAAMLVGTVPLLGLPIRWAFLDHPVHRGDAAGDA
jgi:hypothetical protein